MDLPSVYGTNQNEASKKICSFVKPNEKNHHITLFLNSRGSPWSLSQPAVDPEKTVADGND